FELFSAGFGEFVIPGAAVVVRRAPTGLDPAPALQAVQRGVERALLNAEHLAGHLLDALGDAPSMLGVEGEGAKDEQVEGALGEIDACGHWVPFRFYRKDIRRLVEAQGERRAIGRVSFAF